MGPKKELDKHGISQVLDLQVGENLHDHPGAISNYKINIPNGLGLDWRNIPTHLTAPVEYLMKKTGEFSTIHCNSGAFLKIADEKRPDA